MKYLRLLGFSSLVITTLVMVGCDSPDKVHVGDTVTVTYVATFPDGTPFKTIETKTPLTFVVGSGLVIKGLESGVLGMKVDQTKKITVSPADGFGSFYDALKIQKVSKFVFDKIKVSTKNGTIQKLGDLQGVIKGVEKDENGSEIVLFDINARETWDTLIYEVTLLNKA